MDMKNYGLSLVLLLCYAFVATVLAKLLNTNAGDIVAWMALSFIASEQAKDLLA